MTRHTLGSPRRPFLRSPARLAAAIVGAAGLVGAGAADVLPLLPVQAPWDRPVPRIAPGLKMTPAAAYVVQNGAPKVLRVDRQRLAVGLKSDRRDRPAAAMVDSARSAGIAADSSVELGSGSRLIGLAQPLLSDVHVYAAMEALLADPSVEFASPVLEDPATPGSWSVVTQLINIRVKQARAADARAALQEAIPGADIVQENLAGLLGAFQIRVAMANGFEVIREAARLAEHPAIAWAEPERIQSIKLAYASDDPAWSSSGSWGWEQANDIDTDASAAFDLTRGDPGVKILVLDVGVQHLHPDLNVEAGRDFTNPLFPFGLGDGSPQNRCDNHGTEVAGVVSARIGNGIGGFGVCPGCHSVSARIGEAMVVTPCNTSFSSSDSAKANALAWGLLSGCRITNSSFSTGSSSVLTDAFDATSASGMLHFAASGNDGSSGGVDYPASLSSVIAVGAISSSGALSSFSNYGSGQGFVAPGSAVYTTDRTGAAGSVSGDYAITSGTSFSSPFCAGIAGLIWSTWPELTPTEVRSIMRASARDLGASGYDTTFGYGFPNANTALRSHGPANDWCDTATDISGYIAYSPGGFSTATAGASPSEPHEGCAAGVGSSHSVWYTFTAPCAGTIDIDTSGSSYDTVLSIFGGSCASPTAITCDDDSGTGAAARLTGVHVSAGTTYMIKVAEYGPADSDGGGGTLRFSFAFDATPPDNDSCTNAHVIPTPASDFVAARCTLGATTGDCETEPCSSQPIRKSIWYSFTPTMTGWADIDTNDSDHDTVLSVRSSCLVAILPGGECASNTPLSCDDDSGTGTNAALSNVPMRKGTTYLIRVSAKGTYASGGTAFIHFSHSPCPADYNASGAVSVQDLLDFLSDYFAGSLAADTNGSGTLTLQDLFDYLTLYFSADCH